MQTSEKTATEIKLEGVVVGSPSYSSELGSRILVDIQKLQPLDAPEEYQNLVGKCVEVKNRNVLPIFIGNRLRISGNYKLSESHTQYPVVPYRMIELLDEEGRIIKACFFP